MPKGKTTTPELAPGEKIYWAPARKYSLHLGKTDPELVGNYQREIRDVRGNVTQIAVPITWGSNIFVTADPDVQAVIEKSAAFQNGEIKLCENMGEAEKMTAGLNLKMKVTSGMVSMQDEVVRIDSPEQVQSEISKFAD